MSLINLIKWLTLFFYLYIKSLKHVELNVSFSIKRKKKKPQKTINQRPRLVKIFCKES